MTYKANMKANDPFGYSAAAASSLHDHICTCASTRMHAVLTFTVNVCLTVHIARSTATRHACPKLCASLLNLLRGRCVAQASHGRCAASVMHSTSRRGCTAAANAAGGRDDVIETAWLPSQMRQESIMDAPCMSHHVAYDVGGRVGVSGTPCVEWST